MCENAFHIKSDYSLCAIVLLFIFPFTGSAQSSAKHKGLFDTDSVLNITLNTNMHDLQNDIADNPGYHPVIISYINEDDKAIIINAKAKTRGHFRKQKGNCIYPPLQLRFTKNDSLKRSVFNNQEKLKLVMPCCGGDYVIYEWLVYQLYNIVTPKSFKARLVNVILSDSSKKKQVQPFYGILLEDEYQMAKRNNEVLITKGLNPKDVQPDDFLKMTVFEYLIGNTDWCTQFLQNIKLIAWDSTQIPTAVPYDFDHAGIVSPPYAQPFEALEMSSVRERRYRGYCMANMKEFDSVIALYNRLKPAIYNLYTSCTLIDKKYLKNTIRYLDEFYSTINNPKEVKKEFEYPCDKNGTGNVVIKGLKE